MSEIEKSRIEKYTRSNGTVGVRTINLDKDMAQQHFAKEVDINEIMRRIDKGGDITQFARQQGRYVGLGEPRDLMEAQHRVIKAQQAFLTLPAELRAKLDHNPQEFLTWLNDPTKESEHIEWGLKEKPKPKPDPVPNIPDLK